MGYQRFWEFLKKGCSGIGVGRADLFKDSDKSAVNKNIWEHLIDVFSIFEAGGVSRKRVIDYSLAYIYAVYPKIMEQKLNMMNPFSFMCGGVSKKADIGEDKTAGANDKLTDNAVMDFFSGLV